MRALEEKIAPADVFTTPSQAAWLTANGPFASLHGSSQPTGIGNATAGVGVAAGQLAQEAAQRRWSGGGLKRGRIACARLRARLPLRCGRSNVHVHQRHHEERSCPSSSRRPDRGHDNSRFSLKRNGVMPFIYGGKQMDGFRRTACFFPKKVSGWGSFVNSQGGWGSITGHARRLARHDARKSDRIARLPMPLRPNPP